MNAIAQKPNQRPQGDAGQRNRGFIIPPANISAGENEYLVELEMPGVDQSGLDITVEGDELTIIGWRKNQSIEGDLCYCESSPADYRRVFEIGPDVDAAKINAQMNQGVLRLRLPKSEKAKPRRIEVKAG
jgi:HSP20 family protein